MAQQSVPCTTVLGLGRKEQHCLHFRLIGRFKLSFTLFSMSKPWRFHWSEANALAPCVAHNLSARNQTWTRFPGTFCATSKCSLQHLLCREDVFTPGGWFLASVIRQSRGLFLFRQCLGANVSTMPTKCNSSPPLNTYLKRCRMNAGSAVCISYTDCLTKCYFWTKCEFTLCLSADWKNMEVECLYERPSFPLIIAPRVPSWDCLPSCTWAGFPLMIDVSFC